MQVTNSEGRKGFTLTELLVCVSLGAVLVATILPALNTAQDTMKAAVCLGNMHQWGLAISLYVADQKDYYPYDGSFAATVCNPPNTTAWYNVLPPYIKQAKLCDLYGPTLQSPPTAGMKSIWICPSATNTAAMPTPVNPYFTYSISSCLHQSGFTMVGFRRSRMVSPATTIIFCEEPEDGFSETNGKYIAEDPTGQTYTPGTARHSGGLNFVMGDGHAQWIRIEDYCRNCPSDNGNYSDSSRSTIGDWFTGRPYHWWFFPGASTASQ
jgi:prepilin-type N-terminal cleavage/methylation domain-containing protein/prepilin-type processing-associated H-X9-DG protein